MTVSQLLSARQIFAPGARTMTTIQVRRPRGEGEKWKCGCCEEEIETTKGVHPTFCPNPNCGKKGPFIALLSGKFGEKLRTKAFDLTKFTWNCDTKFVTFIEGVAFQGNDKVIESESTVELPVDMVDELKKSGLAGETPWQCFKCGAMFLEYPINGVCPKCHAGAGGEEKSPMFGLRPKAFKTIGDTLMRNYRFATPRESITESNPGLIHIYNQGHYTPIGTKGYIRQKVKQLMPDSKQGTQKNVIDHISVTMALPEDVFGLKGERTVVENGILDLNTKKLEPHDPDAYALTSIPIKYTPKSGSPVKFLKYLERAIPDKSDRTRIQEVLGTALISKKVHKKGIVLVGPTDVGKSTFIKVIRGIFGEKNVSTQSPNTLANTRWGPAKLRGKLLNATDEVRVGRLSNLAILKRIMDGNPIEAENKNVPTFEFSPTLEHIYACNQTPTANRRDDAFWNRWMVVEMSVQIPPDEQDRDFADKLLEEKESILNWAVEGFEQFKKNSYKFTHPQNWKEARDKWLNWGDSIQRFIQKCVIRSEDRELKIETNRLYEIYTAFADAIELDIQDQKELTAEVKKLPYAEYSNNFRFNGRKQRGFRGIDVKLDTLDTEKIISLYNSLYFKHSDFIHGKENKRIQRIHEEQQKLDETPRKVTEDGAKTIPSEPTVSAFKPEKIEEKQPTVSDVERKIVETFGVLPFKNSQVSKLFPDDAELKKAWGVLEDMRKRGKAIPITLESGEQSWQLTTK